MDNSQARFEGRWRSLQNVAAESKDSIHEGETARSYGYQGGLVTGTIVATAAMPAVVDVFGAAWFEGGWYRFKFIEAVYDTDEVRETASDTEDGAAIDLQIVKRDGTVCAAGAAALGAGQGPGRAWDAAADGRRDTGEHLTAYTVGTTYVATEFVPSVANAERLAGAARDTNEWYRTASPWGGPILPPEHLMLEALEIVRPNFPIEEMQGPPIWTEHALTSAYPVMIDRPHTLRQRLVDKGSAGRTVFLTYEFEVTDSNGTVVAVGRHRLNWFVLPGKA